MACMLNPPARVSGHRTPTRRRLVTGLACLVLLAAPDRGYAQRAAPSSVHPEFRVLPDAPKLMTGVALLLASRPLSITRKAVPPAGLDPKTIHWSVDRHALGEASTRADIQSDYVRDAALAYPLILAFASQPAGTRWNGTARRGLVYSEAVMVAEGVAMIIKNVADRPRPFTYLPIDERRSGSAFDVTSDEAFRSMPSGHTTAAFTAAAFAITDHLISRPQASWQERVAVAAVGGLLAGMTASMRVRGGQHFPSDVIVGGLIGTASGVLVPLVQRYASADGRRAARPSGRAWWQAVGGMVGGISVGVAAVRLSY